MSFNSSLYSSQASSADSQSFLINPANTWNNDDIERNFILVRKILRFLNLKIHIDSIDKTFGTPSNYLLPYECCILIDNFLPEHICVRIRNDDPEIAFIEAKREFCKSMEANCLISMPMYDAWCHVYPLYDKYPHLFDKFAEKAKINFTKIKSSIPSYMNTSNPSPNFKRQIDKILDKIYEESMFSGEQLSEYLYDLDNLGPYSFIYSTIYGTTSNSNRYDLIMYRLRTNKTKFADEFYKYEKELSIYVEAREEKLITKNLKTEAFTLLEETIKKLPVFGAGNCYLVGSSTTNTATLGSDLDIHFSLELINENRQPSMPQLAQYLEKSQNIISIIPIYNAVVPILQITMKPPFDTIKVEISSASPYSVYTSFLVKNYMKLDERARYLSILIKQWATNHGLRIPANGTMSGIALTLMVIHFLQCGCEPAILPNLQFLRPDIFNDKIPMSALKEGPQIDFPGKQHFSQNDATLGELFIAFFDYYSNFKFDQDGISISKGCVISRDDLDIIFDRRGIYVDEPYAHFNTLRSLSDFSLVHHAIKEAYHLLNGPNLETGPPNFRRLMYNHATL